jgi:hypothetical protein
MPQASCGIPVDGENRRIMDKVSSFLTAVLNRRGLASHAGSALVVHRCEQWIKERLPNISPFVTVRSVQDGTLIIACSHSIAQQECQSASADLIADLTRNEPLIRISAVRTIRE